MKKLTLTLIAASTLVGSAFAAPIVIPNFSFESGFDNTGGGIGNWTIAAPPAQSTGPTGGLSATNGGLFLFTNGPGAGGPAVVYQRLDILAAVGDFSFQIDVGFRNDVGAQSNYDIAFYAVNVVNNTNDAELARQTLLAPSPGTWETKTFNFTVTGSEPWYGPNERLQIAFTAPDGIQVNYDNVRGEFTAVPEPTTYVLGLLGGAMCLLVVKRRRLAAY